MEKIDSFSFFNWRVPFAKSLFAKNLAYCKANGRAIGASPQSAQGYTEPQQQGSGGVRIYAPKRAVHRCCPAHLCGLAASIPTLKFGARPKSGGNNLSSTPNGSPKRMDK